MVDIVAEVAGRFIMADDPVRISWTISVEDQVKNAERYNQ